MNYRQMGRTGLRVSELCLGAMTFGRETTEEDSFKILNRFIEAGGNFIDTADVYTDGMSEEILGRWLRDKNRDDFV
ncbi:MAG TPA: aldo/keto reductase, partial [Anaerolineales bacterium]|nr:aldo/keto reductase [Anaerolineales bacterium]